MNQHPASQPIDQARESYKQAADLYRDMEGETANQASLALPALRRMLEVYKASGPVAAYDIADLQALIDLIGAHRAASEALRDTARAFHTLRLTTTEAGE